MMASLSTSFRFQELRTREGVGSVDRSPYGTGNVFPLMELSAWVRCVIKPPNVSTNSFLNWSLKAGLPSTFHFELKLIQELDYCTRLARIIKSELESKIPQKRRIFFRGKINLCSKIERSTEQSEMSQFIAAFVLLFWH